MGLRYGLGGTGCLELSGWGWHGLGMDACMRVHAWAGLNPSLNPRVLEYNGQACRAAVCVGSLDACMHVWAYCSRPHMRQARNWLGTQSCRQTDVPSLSATRSPSSTWTVECEIAILPAPGQGHGGHGLLERAHLLLLGAPEQGQDGSLYDKPTHLLPRYLLASVIGEFAGAIPSPSGVLPAWPPAWLLISTFPAHTRAALRNKWPRCQDRDPRFLSNALELANDETTTSRVKLTRSTESTSCTWPA